ECDLVRLFLVWATSWASGHSAGHSAHVHAKHLSEDVVQVNLVTGWPASGRIDRGHAMGVVHVSLLLIAQDFICLCDSLELRLGFSTHLLGNLVRMVLERQLIRGQYLQMCAGHRRLIGFR